MKVKVTLPKGYGRAYAGVDRFEKSIPTFNVMAFDNNGNRIQEPYPTRVKMGPDMYEFLSYIMPRLAARQGEDLNYEGVVEENRDYKPKHKYIYYGYGSNPFSVGGVDNYPLGPIGYGDEERPKNIGAFGYLNGKPNYLYSLLADAPSPHGSNTRSQVLTNILNDSWDFSPLLGPLYQYKDMEYDAANDLEEKGPRPTDHWVPRIDPKTGEFMRRDDGSIIFVPIPLVQSLPIYNFKHPKWEENPYEAWDMIKDPKTAMDWKLWNKAPSFADYTGKASRTDKKEKLRPMDYLLYNMKLAERPGYFEDYPEFSSKFSGNVDDYHEYDDFINQGFEKFDDNNEEDKLKKQQIIDERKKQVADKITAARRAAMHENIRDIKGQRFVEKTSEARKEAAKQFEDAHLKEMQQKTFDDAKNYYKSHVHEGDTKARNKDIKSFYRALVGKAFFDQNRPLLEARGITPEEKNAVYHYAKDQGWEKYNKIPDDETKMIFILDDYTKNKKDREQQDNILAGIKEPF